MAKTQSLQPSAVPTHSSASGKKLWKEEVEKAHVLLSASLTSHQFPHMPNTLLGVGREMIKQILALFVF